jgi:polysaccharide pyruvyl transferase WcaK-like protein
VLLKIAHLYPHTDNIGDYYVKIGIHKLLEENFSEIEYTELPASSKINRGLQSPGVGGITPDTVDLLNSHDLIVIGGSNLYETINTDQLEISIDALHKIRKPILLLGIGAGWSSISPQFPCISDGIREKLFLLHQKSMGSSVRDYFTRRLLRSYDIGDPEVTGCPAANIFEEDLKPIRNATVFITGLPYRMYVEQTFNPLIARWRQSYRRRRQATVGYLKLLKLLRREGYNFKIFITDARDLPVAEKIAGSAQAILFDESPEALLAHLADCDVMIGYRLHACIPSLSKGIPVIPLPLDGRVLGFIETYGLTEFAVNPYDPAQETQILERVKMALGEQRFAWKVTVGRRNQLGEIMRQFLSTSLARLMVAAPLGQ